MTALERSPTFGRVRDRRSPGFDRHGGVQVAPTAGVQGSPKCGGFAALVSVEGGRSGE